MKKVVVRITAIAVAVLLVASIAIVVYQRRRHC